MIEHAAAITPLAIAAVLIVASGLSFRRDNRKWREFFKSQDGRHRRIWLHLCCIGRKITPHLLGIFRELKFSTTKTKP